MKRREILKGLTILPLAGVAVNAIANQALTGKSEAEKPAADEWLPKKRTH